MMKKNNISHICETDFNGGHSTLFWAILFQGNFEITAFDLCVKRGCEIGETETIFQTKKNNLVKGYSRNTLKEFAKKFPKRNVALFR